MAEKVKVSDTWKIFMNTGWDVRTAGGGGALVPFPTGAMIEFPWLTDQAVQPAYLEKVKAQLAAVPKDRSSLRPGPRVIKEEEWKKQREQLDQRVDAYVNASRQIADAGEMEIPSINPFDLFSPSAMVNLSGWLREQRKEFNYQSSNVRINERREKGYASGDRESEQFEDNYIRVIHAWNRYHVEFLEALNIADLKEREKAVDVQGKEIFSHALGFATTISLEKISPFDNSLQWMVYNAANVLISPDEEITPIARLRAIQLLTLYKKEELEMAYFGVEAFSSPNGGRKHPSDGFIRAFSEKCMRLPRTFWSTKEERTQNIHQEWQNNPRIKKLFGLPDSHKTWDPFTYNYGQIFNKLVEKYPREAVHITMLMMGDFRHQRDAFSGLINMAKLDPITVQGVFGRGATYLSLHKMPSSTDERISEALGLEVFDMNYALDFEGLPNEQLLQVIRRLQVTIMQQDLELALANRQITEAYFASISADQAGKLDPKGYWKLLGVHPQTDPSDLELVLKRSYRALAQKYHPEGSEPDLEKMKQINIAYETLSDETRRKSYTG